MCTQMEDVIRIIHLKQTPIMVKKKKGIMIIIMYCLFSWLSIYTVKWKIEGFLSEFIFKKIYSNLKLSVTYLPRLDHPF